MTDKKELNLEELENASGGKFDDELSDWWERNSETIKLRAENKSLTKELSYLIVLRFGGGVYSLNEFKEKLREIGLNCDDLL